MRTIIKRHGPSNGARALAREMGINMMRLEGSRFRPRPGDRVINWGCSSTDGIPEGYFLNNPQRVSESRNKVAQWNLLRHYGVPTVEWTSSYREATEWLREGQRCLVRTMLRASQGRGITAYSEEGTDWTGALPLPQDGTYVKVFGRNPQHVTEYRIHVVNGRVIDRQQKRRRSDHEGGSNPYIRSAANGWVFCREGCERNERLDTAALEAVEALGLDFGAVDCAVGPEGSLCIYEVNTAPGLEGTTLRSYADALAAGRYNGGGTARTGDAR